MMLKLFLASFLTSLESLSYKTLGPTIDNIKSLDEAVIPQKHDFFSEQPIKGARAYYFRNIFHDWPDKECASTLKNIAEAMKPGYSKLLIFEWVLPTKGVPLYPALLDVNMTALLNGMERTEVQWEALLAQARFEVVKFGAAGPGPEGLIEVVLKQ
jgi:hypothetical protein